MQASAGPHCSILKGSEDSKLRPGSWLQNPQWVTNLLGTRTFRISRTIRHQNGAFKFVESKFSHIVHMKDPRLQMLVQRGRGQVAKLVLDFMRGNGIEVSTLHCNTLLSAFQDMFGIFLEEGMKKFKNNCSDLIDTRVTMTLQRLQLVPMMLVPASSMLNLDEYLDVRTRRDKKAHNGWHG